MDLLQKQQVTGGGASRSDGGQTESTEEEEEDDDEEEEESRKPLHVLYEKQEKKAVFSSNLTATGVARQQGNNERYRSICTAGQQTQISCLHPAVMTVSHSKHLLASIPERVLRVFRFVVENPTKPKGPGDGVGMILLPAPSTWFVHFKKNVRRQKKKTFLSVSVVQPLTSLLVF